MQGTAVIGAILARYGILFRKKSLFFFRLPRGRPLVTGLFLRNFAVLN